MYELTLSTTIDKQIYTTELFKKLNSEIKQDSGIILRQNNNGRTYLAIAIKDNKKEYYVSKILDYVSFMILDDYKYNYFKERINENTDSVVFDAFLRAITIFDSESDKDIIKSQIQLAGDFLIDSFFYFKLSVLRLKWDKTISIINQNGVTSKTQSMVDVLKYLIKMSGNILYVADVDVFKNKINLKTYKEERKYKNNFNGISNLLADLIKCNPVKISIKASEKSQKLDFFHIISEIFEDKVYFTN